MSRQRKNIRHHFFGAVTDLVNGFGSVGSVDESDVVKEAVLLLQR